VQLQFLDVHEGVIAMRHLVLLAVVILSLPVSPTAARQWASRDGAFAVEAELLDVKGGNVVLKKADGSQISVPLNKLSLGDVRYVNDVLRAAEAGVTGAAAEASAPAAAKPQAALTGAAPAAAPQATAAAAGALKKLRYNWKKDQAYVYRVRIIGERGNDTENRSGNVTYKVKSTRMGEVQLAMTGDLKYADVEHSRRYVVITGRHVGFVSNVDKPIEATITIDPVGRLLESPGGAPLPYLLGDLSELVVEPLPRAEEASWTVNSDPGIAVVSLHYPYSRYSSSTYREGVPAAEKTVYTVLGESDNMILISKHYEMTSAASLAGKPRIEASGDGKLKFDPQRGVFASLDFDMRVTVRDSNKTEDTPLHLSYRLLSDEELAEAAKEAQKAKDDADKAEKEKLRPLTDKEIDAAVDDLASDDVKRTTAAAKLLSEKKPQQPNPKVAKALEAVMLHGEDALRRGSAAHAMKNWSTPESVPALIKALSDAWPPVKSSAIEALTKYTPKEAIKPIAQQLLDMQTRGAAEKFLKAAGPDAEDAVLAHITYSDPWTRACVCTLLEGIGTKKSLPALEKAVSDENWMVNGAARKAVAAVKARGDDTPGK
jgi:HEAT repeat protein